ncbi:MAG: aminotransferase class I/II-fold pyridoxal phosphate-dependent enzyme [Salinispira sp.]
MQNFVIFCTYMNSIAEKLNWQLKNTIIDRLLSDFGRRIFFPRGIVAQSAEAAGKAHYLNATIGMAYKDGEAFCLPILRKMLPELSATEAVSYAPTGGIKTLRHVWKDLQKRKNPGLRTKEYSLPMVVAGLTSGIFQMAELFINSGDHIIVPDMYWGNYRLIVSERRGGLLKTFPLFNAEGGFNLEGFKQQLNRSVSEQKSLAEQKNKRGKIILLLNFPNNPTGYSPTFREAGQITHILRDIAHKDNDILTVHDDAYFGLFYDENVCSESLFASCADAHPNILALKIDGATKEDYAWGFRVAFMSFGSKGLGEQDFDPLLNKLMGSIRSSISNSPGISQNLLIKILNSPEYSAQKIQAQKELTARYFAVKKLLNNVYADNEGRKPAGGKLTGGKLAQILFPLPFNSGYFMTFRVPGISAEALRCSLLEKGIGVIAVGEDILRVAFSAVDLDKIQSLYDTIFETAEHLYEHRTSTA